MNPAPAPAPSGPTVSAPVSSKGSILNKAIADLEHSKNLHSVAFWTGLASPVVLVLNQAFGLKLDPTEFVAVVGIVATTVLGSHLTAGAIATAALKVLEAVGVQA